MFQQEINITVEYYVRYGNYDNLALFAPLTGQVFAAEGLARPQSLPLPAERTQKR